MSHCRPWSVSVATGSAKSELVEFDVFQLKLDDFMFRTSNSGLENSLECDETISDRRIIYLQLEKWTSIVNCVVFNESACP
jgi:hypothetical protein